MGIGVWTRNVIAANPDLQKQEGRDPQHTRKKPVDYFFDQVVDRMSTIYPCCSQRRERVAARQGLACGNLIGTIGLQRMAAPGFSIHRCDPVIINTRNNMIPFI